MFPECEYHLATEVGEENMEDIGHSTVQERPALVEERRTDLMPLLKFGKVHFGAVVINLNML